MIYSAITIHIQILSPSTTCSIYILSKKAQNRFRRRLANTSVANFFFKNDVFIKIILKNKNYFNKSLSDAITSSTHVTKSAGEISCFDVRPLSYINFLKFSCYIWSIFSFCKRNYICNSNSLIRLFFSHWELK